MVRRASPGAVYVLIFVAACAFDGAPVAPLDASADGARDVPADSPTARVREGLVGLWTFDEAAGSLVAADSSEASTPVPLRVISGGAIAAAVFGDGEVTATSRSRMVSMPERSRLSADIVAGGGVTLEVWLRPTAIEQGDAATPRFVVGLANNLTNRNIAILQRGNKWSAVVRTNSQTTGTPALVSNTVVRDDSFTHVAVVADPTQRHLYIDDRVELVDPLPGSLTTWEPGALLVLFEEPGGGRFWTGRIALVALYRRALSPDEIHANYLQGPDAQ